MHVTNEHNQSLDTQIMLTHKGWNETFRVTSFEENIGLVTNREGLQYFEYRVLCRGPVQTKTSGRDHATRTNSMIFVENEENWSALPAQIRLALRGKFALIGELRTAMDAAYARALPFGR